MTRTKLEQIEFDKKLEPFYIINGKEYLCKKCNQNIRNSREKHYNICKGFGARRSSASNLENYSSVCDLGCGQTSQFFYKTGKAYCCKFGNSCPVKVIKDSEAKKGINPFANIEHHRACKGKTPWNKGQTKETNSSIEQQGKSFKRTYQLYGDQRKKIHHTPETKTKLSAIALERKIGGYQKGSGRGKKGWYQGYFCDSSWELAYVIYCLEHTIPIERNTIPREYLWQGKIKKYYPDFILYNDSTHVVEIKGYFTDQVEAKMNANPDVKILQQKDLKHVFDYVIGKYGKNYISLYEVSDNNDK